VITFVQRCSALLLLGAGNAAERASEDLEQWLADAHSSGVQTLETSARDSTQDAKAVRAAFTSA
jgi:transposase